MLLSDNEIRTRIQNSGSLIQPFSEDRLQGASYDVSLSDVLTRLRYVNKVIDPTESTDTADLYEIQLIDKNGYILLPGDFVLVELEERLKLPKDLVAHIRPRTRFTRCGIIVTDQHCNPTYEGNLQIGIHNVGKTPFLLVKGLRIAQVVFEEISSEPSEEKLYANKKNAAYQNEKGFRGAVFQEAGWSEEGQKFMRELMKAD